ncbi:sterol desaturase family protein [Undibacterium arcticum]
MLYQFWVHTQQIGKLGWFDRIFVSPSNHRVHHAVNDIYLDKNYGGILIFVGSAVRQLYRRARPASGGVRHA